MSTRKMYSECSGRNVFPMLQVYSFKFREKDVQSCDIFTNGTKWRP